METYMLAVFFSLLAIFLVLCVLLELLCLRGQKTDRRQHLRNAVFRLMDGPRLNAQAELREAFTKALTAIAATESNDSFVLASAAGIFKDISRKAKDPLDKSYCLCWAGRCYEDNDEIEKALACYESARAIAPSDAFALESLAEYCFEDDPEKAEKCYRQILEFDPLNAVVEFRIGNLYAARGDSQGAIRHYRRAIELDNSYISAMAEAAIESAKAGDKPEVFRYYCLAMGNGLCEYERLENAMEAALNGEEYKEADKEADKEEDRVDDV